MSAADLRAEKKDRRAVVQTIPDEKAASGASRFVESPAAVWALLAIAAATLCVNSLRPYTHSEVRYVEAGLEMATGGDWVVPHLAFVAYFEKPILAYWAEAASLLAFGLNPLSARLQAILSGVFMVWATFAIGRELRGRTLGLGAAALVLASAMFGVLGSVVTADPLFSACLVGAWYAFWRHDRDPQSAWIWAFWTALGSAVLTKGPLGVALVGATVAAYLLLAGRFLDFLEMRPVRGALVIVAINGPWSWLVWQRDPRFLEFFYYRQNLLALVDSRINHGGPIWFYEPILVGGFFPFVPLAAWALGAEPWTTFSSAIRRLLRRDGATDPSDARLYANCMLLPPLLLLSVSASKLGTYLMPLLPGAALVCAFWLADRLESPPAFLRRALLVQAALVTLVVVTVFVVVDRFPPDVAATLRREARTAIIAAVLLVAPLVVGGYGMLRGRIVRGMTITALGSITALAFIALQAERLGTDRLAGGLARQLVRVRQPGERVLIQSALVDDYSVVLALRERMAIWGSARELGLGHFTEARLPPAPLPHDTYEVSADGKTPVPENPWLVDDKRVRAAWQGKDRVWVVCRMEDVDRLRAMGLDVHVLAQQFRKGVVTNQPLPETR